jgi:tRNA 2-thiouridine synthesizing protein A
MSNPLIDITRDVCPLTFVKVKMALTRIAPSGKLEVLLKEEALKNVVSSLKSEGHRVSRVERRDGGFLLEVDKKGEAT